MENSLYPIKFEPIYKSKIWGGSLFRELFGRKNVPADCGESWEISCFDDNMSVVSNGFLAGNTLQELIEVYMGDLVGDSVYERFGLEFPLLVKFIDANDDLSVQVHPGDDLALERHKAYGKTEMWYVINSQPGAELINGFKAPTTRQQYASAVDEGSVLSLLNAMPVSKGDVFYIPAGRIHAIGKGVMVAEIQQTSDITYRIYDYNRRDSSGNLRELHTDLAIDAIDYKYYNDCRINCKPQPNKSVSAVDCEYFTTNVLNITMPIEKDFPEIDSFIIYMCMEGACRIEYDGSHSSIQLSKGETVLVPASIKNLCYFPEGSATLLEVYING